VAIEEDVGRLDVAMDVVLGMNEIERPGNVRQPVAQGAQRHRLELAAGPRGDPILEAAAGKILHDDKRQIPEFSDVDDLDDMRMTERHQRPNLGAEAVEEGAIVRPLIAGDGELENHVGIQVTVKGTVDVPHASLTDPAQDLVAPLGDLLSDPFAVVGFHLERPRRR